MKYCVYQLQIELSQEIDNIDKVVELTDKSLLQNKFVDRYTNLWIQSFNILGTCFYPVIIVVASHVRNMAKLGWVYHIKLTCNQENFTRYTDLVKINHQSLIRHLKPKYSRSLGQPNQPFYETICYNLKRLDLQLNIPDKSHYDDIDSNISSLLNLAPFTINAEIKVLEEPEIQPRQNDFNFLSTNTRGIPTILPPDAEFQNNDKINSHTTNIIEQVENPHCPENTSQTTLLQEKKSTSSGLDPSELDPSELDPSELDPSELDPSELDPSELDPSELDPSELDPSELDPSALVPSALVPSKTIPSEGELTASLTTPVENLIDSENEIRRQLQARPFSVRLETFSTKTNLASLLFNFNSKKGEKFYFDIESIDAISNDFNFYRHNEFSVKIIDPRGPKSQIALIRSDIKSEIK